MIVDDEEPLCPDCTGPTMWHSLLKKPYCTLCHKVIYHLADEEIGHA